MERLNIDKVKMIAAAATLAMFAGTAAADVKLEGQVNRMVSFTRDGHQSNTLFLDNNFAPTTFGFSSQKSLDKCTCVGGELDVLVTPNNSSIVSQVRTADLATNFVLVRTADVWASYRGFGKISLGYGDAASYGITRMSFAGTADTVSSAQVSRLAGGMQFHRSASGVPVVATDPLVRTAFNSLDGVGSIFDNTGLYAQKNRIRWDSSDWCGFMVSASYGNVQSFFLNSDTLFNQTQGNRNTTRTFADVALRYEGNFSDFMVAAGIAYAQWSTDSFYNSVNGSANNVDIWTFNRVPAAANVDRHPSLWAGSIALEHKCTGLNIAASYGNLRRMFTAADNTKSFFVQIGKHNCWTNYGQTDLVVDYFQGNDTIVNSDKSRSWGLGVVQNLDKVNSQVYATYRNYKYDGATTGGAVTPANVALVNDYSSINVVSLGMMFKFGAML